MEYAHAVPVVITMSVLVLASVAMTITSVAILANEDMK